MEKDLGLICVAGSLGSLTARSLSVLQLGSLSLRPFALFNCLREKFIIQTEREREGEHLLAASAHYFMVLGSVFFYTDLSPIPQAAQTSLVSSCRSHSLSISLSLSLFTLCALWVPWAGSLSLSCALPLRCILSLVAAETRLACSVSIEVRFRSQQERARPSR